MLIVSPYNPAWPNMAQEEITAIKEAYGSAILDIFHMGSTSVPGLNAKPIIDMIVVTDAIVHFDDSKLITMGYTNRGELIIPFRTVLHRGDPRSHFVHVFEKGDPQIEQNLRFREYLRANPEKKSEYAHLKQNLATKFKGSKTFWGYTRLKTHFIQDCLRDAGFDHYIFTRAYAPEELNAFTTLMRDHGVADQDLIELTQETLLLYDRNYFILTQFGEVLCGAIVEKVRDTYQVSAIAASANAPSTAKRYFEQQIHRWIRQAQQKKAF